MDYAKESLRLHEEWKGKIEVIATVPVEGKEDLSLAYTPGVAQPCLEIQRDVEKSYELTRRHNLCAVITDGSAVLGLGDIGPEAGMPVMEGKCVLFKAFGGVDAFPLCVKTHDVDEFVNAVYLMSGSFGGINLEDIAAPRCFEIERKLKEKCDIPIFHDDQHGTAVITLAGLTNALKVVGKKKEDVRIVTSGAGAAAVSIVKLLLSAGYKHVTMCDRKGAIYAGREGLNWIKEEMAQVTNLEKKAGSLADMLAGADVFIGVSAPGTVTTDMVKTMNKDAVIFACANPTPEIFPEDAKAGGAAVIATEGELHQIIYNLGENAIKYNHRGGFVRIRAESGEDATVITVEDNGIGIPPEDLPNVFKRFYRVDKARSRESGGTGLGLAIVKHIVARHGARLELESSPGQGTTVRVLFAAD